MKVGIIGGGHNGLVTAGYLAQAGFDVSIYEKRSECGGICVSEELFAGYKVSSVASYFGMLRKRIITDMELAKHGFEAYLTDPAEIVLLPDGDYIFTPRDGSGSQYSISELTQSELDGWNLFWSDIGKAAGLFSPLYFKPETTCDELIELLRKNDLDKIADTIFDASLLDLMKKYFSHEKLLAAASTCTPGFSSNKGTVFGCLHHGTAETCDVEGAWGLVKGGMGAIPKAMEAFCLSKGVKVFTNKAVAKILTDTNDRARVNSILFEDGSKEDFDLIVSNADHNITFGKLVDDHFILNQIPQHFKEVPSPVSAGKIQFALNSLPKFPTLDKLGHNYAGIIAYAPPISSVISDSKNVPEGKLPEQLMLTMAIPSVTDDSIAPADKHLLNLDVHYLPAYVDGKPWSEADNQALLDLAIKQLDLLAPGIKDHIDESYVISPGVLAKRYGLKSMSCWQLPMTEYAFNHRNIGDLPAYHTPIENLFLCGAGTYGGGNVTGISGYNCAQTIIKAAKSTYATSKATSTDA